VDVLAVEPYATHINSLSPTFTVCKNTMPTLHTYRCIRKLSINSL
jgi:hypothetical protein